MSILLVAFGGAIGASLRFMVSLLFAGSAWPVGTLMVNIIGCLAMGGLAGSGLSAQARVFWLTGVLGGFTTFSAFSLEAAMLWERAAWQGVAYVVASVALSLAAFSVGWLLARG